MCTKWAGIRMSEKDHKFTPKSSKSHPKWVPNPPKSSPGAPKMASENWIILERAKNEVRGSYGVSSWSFFGVLGRPKFGAKPHKIDAKARKKRRAKITWFLHRFFSVFRGARTPKIELSSRRNANFRKIDVFRKSAKNHHFWDPKIDDFCIFGAFFGRKN